MKKFTFINFLMLTVAGIINATGVTLFLMPVNLYDSGISGTSMFLSQITPDYLNLSLFLIILNVPLFLYGLKKEGVVFTVYSIYVVIIYSLVSFLITDVLPINVNGSSPLAGNDLLLCALFGGLISGIGSGLAIRFGGAVDGIEVMAVIFAKKIGVSVGTFIMVFNCILYVCCGIANTWDLPLYSIIAYTVGLKTVDFIVEGISKSKSAMIITEKHEEVSKAIMETFKSGITLIPAKGGYSNTDKTVLYFVVNRFQITKLRELVHDIDENAYISITEVAEVFSVT